ncbi:MAG: hypothetical protein JRI25_15660 [Deltaproteobacteria bacterium]|nr:hypothetical protein [Deltaproteobacteria bacterium]MBW2256019.1 hypothetical protein [Deltaproteobacteria bacterium]
MTRTLWMAAMVALGAACNGNGDDEPSAAVTVTVDGSDTVWGDPIPIFTTADETYTLNITDQGTAGWSLLMLGPEEDLPGEITTFGACPSGSEQPTEHCGDVIVGGDAFDTPTGSLEVTDDPIPATWVDGEFDLEFVEQGGTRTAQVVGSFSAMVGGY